MPEEEPRPKARKKPPPPPKHPTLKKNAVFGASGKELKTPRIGRSSIERSSHYKRPAIGLKKKDTTKEI